MNPGDKERLDRIYDNSDNRSVRDAGETGMLVGFGLRNQLSNLSIVEKGISDPDFPENLENFEAWYNAQPAPEFPQFVKEGLANGTMTEEELHKTLFTMIDLRKGYNKRMAEQNKNRPQPGEPTAA